VEIHLFKKEIHRSPGVVRRVAREIVTGSDSEHYLEGRVSAAALISFPNGSHRAVGVQRVEWVVTQGLRETLREYGVNVRVCCQEGALEGVLRQVRDSGPGVVDVEWAALRSV